MVYRQDLDTVCSAGGTLVIDAFGWHMRLPFRELASL
jgi:hypothetical protein